MNEELRQRIIKLEMSSIEQSLRRLKEALELE